MKDLTYEKSVEAAKPIKQMAEIARTLDVEYLTEAVKQMKASHSFRESAMVLNPNPFTAIEQGNLEAVKIRGLELMLELAENSNAIYQAELELQQAKMSNRDLGKLFGF